MKFLALIKKENLLVMKSWQTYFLSLFVPILVVIINVVLGSSSITTLNIGVVAAEKEFYEEIISALVELPQVQFQVVEFTGIDEAMKELEENEISTIARLTNGKNITIHYYDSRQYSKVAAQYLVNSIQTLISKDLLENFSQDVHDLQEKQKYIILPMQSINMEKEKNNDIDNMVLYGLMWIFIFNPLSLAISQIQSERSSGTIYYLFKIKMSKLVILLAKQTAIFLQNLLCTGIFLLITKLTKIYEPSLSLKQLPLAILLIMSISSMGYLVGFLLNNTGATMMVTLIFTLPTMLVSMLNTKTCLDSFIKIVPTYYVSNILSNMASNTAINYKYVIICSISTLFLYILTSLYFTKREPMKLSAIP